MDHIPHPKNPACELPTVRIFSSDSIEKWGRVGFLAYLKTIGWTIDDVVRTRTTQKTPDEVHYVLQQWLYFGLLSEVTGITFGSVDFALVTPSSAEPVLNSANLLDILDAWVARETSTDDAVLRQHLEDVVNFQTIAASVCNMIFHGDPDYLDGPFQLSLRLLFDALLVAISKLELARGMSFEDRFANASTKIWGSYGAVIPQMKLAGWCPSTIHMLQERLTVSEMVFSSMLDAPGADKDHGSCTSHACFAYQVQDESTYVTKHVAEDCTCEFVHANTDELGKILAQTDSVPIVEPTKPQRGADGRLYVRLSPSRASTNNTPKPYVAISHVWSDGMGNPKSNAVPLCVFQRLGSWTARVRTASMSPEMPFWFDTLCFPLEPQEAYDTAMIRMRQSYEESYGTLVIDHYLLKAAAADASTGEVGLRMLCGPWSRRLWTLQEAVLPPRLLVQFADGPSNPSHWACGVARAPTLQELLLSHAAASYLRLRSRESRSKPMPIKDARAALAFRSTSVATDEPLCLGTLLGVDPVKVVGAQVAGDATRTRDERLKVIWSSLKELPMSFAFSHFVKMKEPGYRWAPDSLMGYCVGHLWAGHGSAFILAGRGLQVALPSIIIPCSSLQRPAALRLVVDGIRFIVQWCPKSQARSVASGGGAQSSTVVSASSTFAIIVPHNPLEHGDDEVDAANAQIGNLGVVDGDVATATDGSSCSVLRSVDRVRVYQLDGLKYHPDDEKRSAYHGLAKEERAEAIWQLEPSPVVTCGYEDKRTWCLD